MKREKRLKRIEIIERKVGRRDSRIEKTIEGLICDMWKRGKEAKRKRGND
jgi:hypothetical protein